MAKSPKKTSEDATQAYTVLSDLNGEEYPQGSEIELTAAQAEPLLALGRIKPAVEAAQE